MQGVISHSSWIRFQIITDAFGDSFRLARDFVKSRLTIKKIMNY